MYLHEVADHEASFTKEEMQVGKHTEYEKRLIAYYLDVIAKEKDGGGSTGGAKSSSPVNTTSVNGKTSSNQPTQLSSSPPGLQQSSSSTTTFWNGHQPYQHNGSSSQLSSSQAYQEGRSSSSVTVAKSSSSTSVYSNGKGSEQSISSKNSSKQVYGAKSKNSSHQESGDYQHSNIHSMESVSSNQQYGENGRRKNNSASSKESVRRQPLLELPLSFTGTASFNVGGGHSAHQDNVSNLGEVCEGRVGLEGGVYRGAYPRRGPLLGPRPAPLIALSLPPTNSYGLAGNRASRGNGYQKTVNVIPATRQVYEYNGGPSGGRGGRFRGRGNFANRTYYN